MKRLGIALLALLIAIPAFGAEITGKVTVSPQHNVSLQVTGIAPKGSAIWQVDPLDGQDPNEIEWVGARKGSAVKWIGPKGRYKITCTLAAIDKDGVLDLDIATKVVTIGEPVPPVPPVPPTPPMPPTPIPTEGFRVLIVYETAELSKLPAGQSNILYAKAIRDYLNSKCVTETDGKTKAWRMWDKDVDVSGEDKVWQDAMKRDRKQVPWLIISNGKTGYEGGLPASVDDTLTLLKKYGDK